MNEDTNKHLINIDRAEESKRILNSFIFKEAFGKLETEFYDKFKSANDKDVELIKDMHKRIQILDEIKEQLSEIIETGKSSEKELSYLEKIFK